MPQVRRGKTAMRKVAILVLLIGYLITVPRAAAHVQSPVPENGCDLYYQTLRHTPAVVRYAKTGDLSRSWRPRHSRAWYIAALGMRNLLKPYLEMYSRQGGEPDLLLAAVYTGRKGVVAMLLKMKFNPNQPSERPPHILPLQSAAQCARPIIMIYLLEAGANIYGTSPETSHVAMADAIVGPWLNRPFVDGVKLLLASGFDSRCPVTKSGYTALDVVKKGLQHEPKSSGLRELQRLLNTATKIAVLKHPERPRCGGLNWWHGRHQIEKPK